MTCIVPYLILFIYAHVAHLDRQEVFNDRLPYTAVIDILANAEYRRLAVGIADLIQTFFLNVSEISLQIVVAEE